MTEAAGGDTGRCRKGYPRIRDAAHHPERYALVEKMAADAGCTMEELMTNETEEMSIDLKKYVSENVGIPHPPGHHVRTRQTRPRPCKQFEAFSFVEGVEKPKPRPKTPMLWLSSQPAFGHSH